MFSNWNFSEALAKVVPPSTEDVAEAKAKREAEIKVEEAGEGICSYCKQEIIKNEQLAVWESEFLIGYCPEARDHKHKPKIVWKNVQS